MKKQMIVGMLVGALSLGVLTGCGQKVKPVDGKATVMTVDKEDVSMGELMTMVRYQQALTYDQYQAMLQQYASAGYSASLPQMWNMKLSDDELKDYQQTLKDSGFSSGRKIRTVGDRLVDSTAYVMVSNVVASSHAEEYGVTLTKDDEKHISETAAKFMKNTDKTAISDNGITKESVEEYLRQFTLAQKVKTAYQAKQTVEVTNEESQMMTVSFLRFSKSQEGDSSSVKKQAEKVFKDLISGESINIQKLVEESDNVNMSRDSMPVNAKDAEYIFDKKDILAISKLSVNEIYNKLLEAGDGYYIIRLDNPDDKDAQEKYKADLTAGKLDELYQSVLDKWVHDADISCDTVLMKSIVLDDNIVYTALKKSDKENVKRIKKSDESSNMIEQNMMAGEDISVD